MKANYNYNYCDLKKKLVYRLNGRTFNKTVMVANYNLDKFGEVDHLLKLAENRFERYLRQNGVKEINCVRLSFVRARF